MLRQVFQSLPSFQNTIVNKNNIHAWSLTAVFDFSMGWGAQNGYIQKQAKIKSYYHDFIE
ncbi:hypothetical protein DPZ93_15685 [Salmonella enterica subsp. enterica serovar Newport]|nr:hypothetical protein [Salmonella enterica subsp. enterica serovar Newport]EBW6562985.1 hypothetical protein [Salmonella enterica subsp. enterica serovar Newport]